MQLRSRLLTHYYKARLLLIEVFLLLDKLFLNMKLCKLSEIQSNITFVRFYFVLNRSRVNRIIICFSRFRIKILQKALNLNL